MNLQFNRMLQSFKEAWLKLEKARQKQIILGTFLILFVSIIVPIGLRTYNESHYALLYENLSTQEQADIYLVLSEMNVDVSTNDTGNLMVPRNQVDELKLRLSALGYPKSALSYDVFTSNAGFMATELEKQQYLIIDLQNRLEGTLKRIDGVRSAVVTLNIPESSNYVWQENNQAGSASVLLDFSASMDLDSKTVSGIKNLVASAVPNMEKDAVVVIDAASGQELGQSTLDVGFEQNYLQIQFEQDLEERLQTKVVNLLSMPFGFENIRVSASVVIDYDKMLSEELKYIPNEDGTGVIQSLEKWYADGGSTTGGVAGGTNNTELPVYQEGSAEPTEGEYTYSAEYLVSYLKTQIEKNNAELKDATISIVLNSEALSDEERTQWTQAISKAINIPEEKIGLHVFQANVADEEPALVPEEIMDSPYFWPVVIGGAVLIVFIIALIIFLIVRKKRKQKGDREDINQQINSFTELAKTRVNTIKTDPSKATINDIQQFADENPEIAANLIREMLKEEEES